MKPKDTQKKRADIRLLICSVTICTIFMLLFLPSVLINVIKVTGSKTGSRFMLAVFWAKVFGQLPVFDRPLLKTVHINSLKSKMINDHRIRVGYYRSIEFLWPFNFDRPLWRSNINDYFRDRLTRGYTWRRQMLHGSILVSIQLFMQWWIRAFEKVKNFVNKISKNSKNNFSKIRIF